MHRFVLAAVLPACLPAFAQQPQTGQLDASPALFTVMAAINAGGFDADLSSPYGHPLRQQIRGQLAKRHLQSIDAIKAFVAKHRLNDSTAELSQYISFALSCDGPPDFAIKERSVDIPPDASPLLEFSILLSAFYKEADIEDLWKSAQPAINQYIARYHAPVSEAVLQANLYLRQQTSGVEHRRFQVYVALLAPPNQIQTRSYGSQYTIVVTPSPEVRAFDVRHAYLHYLLEPLAAHNEEILNRKKGIAEHVLRARALDDSFKEDFPLLTTECLIKAIEARLDHKPDAVQQALHAGYILTPFFAEQLPVYEKQESGMAVYYPEMVGAIDLVKEDRRLANIQFDTQAPVRTLPGAVRAREAEPPALTGAAKTLDDAEQLYTLRKLDDAKKGYLAVLQQTDSKPVQAAAYYGLARIAILQKDPETGQKLFETSLQLEPEPPIKAWVLVYLGKLSIASGETDKAGKYFHDALQVPGASNMAREEAQQGLQHSSKQ